MDQKDGKKYSDTDNPFNDLHLSQKFVWSKKRPGDKKLTQEEVEERDRQRREEANRELEKLRKQREQREQDKRWMEQERERLAREKERMALGNWEEREERFHLDNAKLRAAVRIREQRPTPIDLLVMNININERPADFKGCDIMVDEPYVVFGELSEDQLQTLQKEMESFKRLEGAEREEQAIYWTTLLELCKDELQKRRLIKARGQKSFRQEELPNLTAAAFAPSAAMADDILRDIYKLLSSKSGSELKKLEASAERKLNAKAAVDVDYWETLLAALRTFQLRATIKQIHAKILMERLAYLKYHPEESKPVEEAPAKHRLAAYKQEEEAQAVPINADTSNNAADNTDVPLPITVKSSAVIQPTESLDERNIRKAKEQILGKVSEAASIQDSHLTRFDNSAEAERLFHAEAQMEMDSDEEAMDPTSVISNMSQQYNWQDKYRPRKPRYFNRVHTGYDWNKYNRTHYDENNPPPKTVQGYKFNIFYPDLIDPSKAPTYKILPDPDPEMKETVLLKFSAGPPYEDIAFRIVNNEWELNYRRGFKCAFERGTLQLWFRFKRSR